MIKKTLKLFDAFDRNNPVLYVYVVHNRNQVMFNYLDKTRDEKEFEKKKWMKQVLGNENEIESVIGETLVMWCEVHLRWPKNFLLIHLSSF